MVFQLICESIWFWVFSGVQLCMNTTTINQMDVSEAATFLGVSVHFIRRLIAERRIRYYKLGKYVRFTVTDLTEFALGTPTEPRKR